MVKNLRGSMVTNLTVHSEKGWEVLTHSVHNKCLSDYLGKMFGRELLVSPVQLLASPVQLLVSPLHLLPYCLSH